MFRLLALALAAFGLGVGSAARADEAEDRAVALVQKLGGEVTRDDTAPGKPVICVSLGGLGQPTPKVTDADLKELAAIKGLTTLHLGLTAMTDAGLKELAALKKLTVLNVYDTKLTDAGLKELQKALPNGKVFK